VHVIPHEEAARPEERAVSRADDTSTPMLRQYREIKQRHPGHVLFYRMGDFYEMFFEDARIAHEVLGLALTSRGQQGGENVPLAGFPYHALEPNLARMVRAGHRVAVCEQVEDPRKAKGLVRRDVVEVVTAGTNFSEAVVSAQRNNYLAALAEDGPGWALAWADVTTGEFRAGSFSPRDLRLLLASLEPAELLVSRSLARAGEGRGREVADLVGSAVLTRLEDWFFDPTVAARDLREHYGTQSLKGFGLEELPQAAACAGALLAYARENLRSPLEHFSPPARHDLGGCLLLDPATRRNLELTRTLSGDEQGPTLLSVLDQAVTPMGRRLLRSWLWAVPGRLEEIRPRQEAVAGLIEERRGERLAALLKPVGDLERLIGRLAAGKANGRDLRALAAGLAVVPAVRDLLAGQTEGRLGQLADGLDPLPDVLSRITQTLVDSPPLSLSQGGIIRDGVDTDLDELREILAHGRDWLKSYEQQEREASGIANLKIRHNKIFGYHIEISRSNLDRVPERYQRRQTLVGAERYITEELKSYEDKVLHAEERVLELEERLFRQLTEWLRPHYGALQRDARHLAELDLLASLAELARRRSWCRPVMVEEGELHLRQARHPVVELVLPAGERFVPNDVTLSSGREQVLLLTGPNMAGKSTYLRMVGLITLLAHMGSYVPAAQATIPLRDQIFTRVGASDNLAKGESTFLVEMQETAFILNHATDRSLVLLDEIGRGTSTFDGLSLAWAITEFLHDAPGRRALTLFATHYHELVDLEQSLPRLRNANIEVRQFGERILFTRRILPGGCSHSYGIDVARMAGLPREVLQRAREVLAQLESQEYAADRTPVLQQRPSAAETARTAQLALFAAPDQDLRERLRAADLENMTPLEAMRLLIELRGLLD
jgi:DNA mismatch repair protein MutS